MPLFSQIVGGTEEVGKSTVEVREVTRRLVLDELPVEIIVDIASNLDFEGFGNVLGVSSFVRCILRKYWRGILPGVIEREFGPVDLFFQAFSSGGGGEMGGGRVAAGQWLGKLSSGGGLDGCGVGIDKDLDRIMNFCRLVKLWEGEFQRLRFYECQAEHHRLLTDRELLRVRRAIYIWHWFARVHHSGRQARNIIGTVYFLRRFSTTELHELWDLYGTVSAAVNREICPSVEMVMEVVGDKAQAENIGWGYGAENALILKTIMRLGPGDLMRLLRERWRLGGKASLVRWVRTKEPWIEDSIEVMGMAILGVKFERENMMGLEKGVFPVEGFPGRFGGVLDHEMVEGEELRVLHGGDGGRESGMYGRIGEGFMIEGVRAGRLVARWSG